LPRVKVEIKEVVAKFSLINSLAKVVEKLELLVDLKEDISILY